MTRGPISPYARKFPRFAGKRTGSSAARGSGSASATALSFAANHLDSARTGSSLTHTSGTITPTAGGTPTAGNVLWLRVELSGTTNTLSSVTGTLGGTWNEMTDGNDLPLGTTGGGYKQYLLWCSDFGASGTIVTTASGACNHYVRVYETTGVNETTPFIAGQARGTINTSGPATTVSYSLASLPTHATVGWVTAEQGTGSDQSAGTGLTKVHESALTGAHGTAFYKGTAVPGPQAFNSNVGIFTQNHTCYYLELNAP